MLFHVLPQGIFYPPVQQTSPQMRCSSYNPDLELLRQLGLAPVLMTQDGCCQGQVSQECCPNPSLEKKGCCKEPVSTKPEKEQTTVEKSTLDFRGFSPEQITAKVVDKCLIVRGEQKNDHTNVQVSKSIPLPEGVDKQNIACRFENGFVTVHFPVTQQKVKKLEKSSEKPDGKHEERKEQTDIDTRRKAELERSVKILSDLFSVLSGLQLDVSAAKSRDEDENGACDTEKCEEHKCETQKCENGNCEEETREGEQREDKKCDDGKREVEKCEDGKQEAESCENEKCEDEKCVDEKCDDGQREVEKCEDGKQEAENCQDEKYEGEKCEGEKREEKCEGLTYDESKFAGEKLEEDTFEENHSNGSSEGLENPQSADPVESTPVVQQTMGKPECGDESKLDEEDGFVHLEKQEADRCVVEFPGSDEDEEVSNLMTSQNDVTEDDDELTSTSSEEKSENTDPDVFKLDLELSNYNPDQIRVVFKDGEVIVEAERDIEGENYSETESITRRIRVPENVDESMLKSFLSEEGLLTIQAPYQMGDKSVLGVTDMNLEE